MLHMYAPWGEDLVEVKKSLKVDGSVPTSGSYNSPLVCTLLCSLYMPFFTVFLILSFFSTPSSAYSVSSFLISLLYIFPQSFPQRPSILHAPSAAPFLSFSPPPSCPSSLFLPFLCLADSLRACVVISITDTGAAVLSPGHWDLPHCQFSFQLSNLRVILQLVNIITVTTW